MYRYMQAAEHTADQISKIYLSSSRWMIKEAGQIFERFRAQNNLSEYEARQLLNTLEDKSSLEEIKHRLRAGNASKERKVLLAKLEAPAYAARIERLQQLQSQLDLIMEQVYKQEKKISTAHYIELAEESYYRTIFDVQQRAGVAFSFSYIDQKAIDKILAMKWSGKNYSERIWTNTESLAATLKEEALVSFMTGRTNRETAEVIANKFAQGAANARRLVRTESAYLSTELSFNAYRDMKVKEYQFLATLDLRTSEVCRELDLQYFPVSDRKIGVNCPPMHPWCRSTTVPIVDRKYLEGRKRSAIDPITGRTILVPRTMSYKDWYKEYVEGDEKAKTAEKKVRNIASDQKQHEKYKEILGDNVPDKLDDFQEMKYNDGEKWKFTQLDYRRRKELIDNPNLRLPNAENAILPEEKFTKYLLGGENEKGLAKGKAFTSRLGYDIGNWEELQKELKKGATRYPARFKGETEYGLKYEQKMILYGENDIPANVVVGWMQRKDKTLSMTSAYIKEVD